MWNEKDEKKAVEEGWNVFAADDGTRIERIDELGIFQDDGAAWAFVVRKAKTGSELHIKALKAVSRTERERIRSATGY